VSTVSGSDVAGGPDWRWLAVSGALVGALGSLAVLFPLATGLSISVLFGGLLVVAGFAHLVHAFTAGGVAAVAWQGLLAVVYTVTGISLLANPVVGLASLSLLLIAYFLAAGVVEVGVGIQRRDRPYWLLTVASGAISIILASLLWAGFPSTAAWALGLLLGVNLLASGIAMVAMAWAVRSEGARSSGELSEESGLSRGAP
jgi:uncharacterized membrane protein HdeD (DUF308 family)